MDCKCVTSLLLFLSLLYALFAAGVSCPDTEREALLVFRRGLHSTVNDFSSWLGKDCCKWNRVGCDNATGHVVSLDLSFSQLSERIPDQLGNLSRLQTLDLSGNVFQYSTIPEFIGSFKELNYLNISFSWFSGEIPNQLGNLSRLHTLDLSGNQFDSTIPEFIGSFKELNYLDLSFSHFFGKIPDQLGNLSKLHTLDLNGNELNELGESFSGCIRNSLQELDLSANSLSGDIPDSIGGLKSLKILNLSRNSLSGSVLDSLGRLSLLQDLDISYNKLNGTVSESLGQLNELVTLALNNNSLVGVLTEHHFANLTRLKSVDLSGNSLVLNMSSNWVPPFQLDSISTSSCTLGPRFPSWLLTQETLTRLDLSFAGIFDTIPNWFWNSSSTINLMFLDISNNNLSGGIPEWLCNFPQLLSLNLSNNKFSGELPLSLKNCTWLHALDLNGNMFTGRIPTWLGGMPSLRLLVLASNKFVGEIPPELSHIAPQILDLSSNKLSGAIPRSIGNLSMWAFDSLPTIMNLSRNGLSGSIPEELTNLTGLAVLDLSKNDLTGHIPYKIGDLLELQSLDLSSNGLSGEIPSSLSDLIGGVNYLNYLNLAYNNLSGRIPARVAYSFPEPYSYVGNAHLCGFPLNVSCPGDNDVYEEADEEESWEEKLLFWLITGVGFAVCFWGVVGVVLVNESFRVRFFLFIDDLCNKTYVTTVLGFRRLKRKFARSSSSLTAH